MTNRRKKILFFADDVTLAHVGRPLVLASALDPAQYEVHFAVSERSARFLRDTEFAAIHWIQTLSPEVFLHSLATGKIAHTPMLLQSYVKEDRSLIEKVNPDIVIGDFRLSLPISTKIKGVPLATLVNFHWSPFAQIPQMPTPDVSKSPLVYLPETWASRIFAMLKPLFFNKLLRPFNQTRVHFGLSPLRSLNEVYTTGDYTLYMDFPGGLPSLPLPPNHRMIGSPIWSPSIPLPHWWYEPDPKRKTVYLSLGSSGQVHLLPALVRELSRLPINLLVSTAARAERNQDFSASGPGGVWVHPYLPGSLASRRSDLVICNGGASTAYQALAEGTPVLGIPSNLDQHLTLIHPIERGAARSIRSDRFRADEFVAAVQSLLSDERYRMAAQGISEDFRKFPAETLFIQWLREVLPI